MEFDSFCDLNVWRVCGKMRFWNILLLLVLLKSDVMVVYCGSDYLVGLGSYDITGPAADVNLMGYAKTEQVASGIHFRLRARAFVVAASKGNRVVFVNIDACMASQVVTTKVIERLRARYGDLYTENNVAISGTHTHAGPGGYLQYFLYIITSYGFVRQSFDVIVDGIEKSIVQAHENLRPGSIFVDEGELLDAGVNRSPSAYLNNPASERSKYKYNVDKEMTLLKFVDDERGPVGSFNWFATHPTSMGRRNSLISGDNKGAASRFMEDWFEKKDSGRMDSDVVGDDGSPQRISNIIHGLRDNHHELLEIAASFQSPPGRPATKTSSVTRRVRGAPRNADKPRFIAAFCQSNSGDVSPNVLGAFWDAFGEGLYNSCKDVKFGTANSLVMQFIGGGAQNVKEWFAFIGKKAAPGGFGSPYAIMFPPNATKSSGMEPMNVSAYSCGDISLGCSCGDCPSSSVCSSSSSTTTQKRDSCSLKIGTLMVKCVDLTLTVLYIILLSVFLGWGLYYRTRERKPAYRTKSVSNVISGGQLHSRNQEKDENLPMHQIIEDVSQNRNEVRLSAVQGYMSNFYRKYGLYVARNPIMVLASSLAIVILLCLGLIRFKVETRPEKLWVGPGSKAAEEKQFFDSHLAPFYRIEQLILGTVPDHVNSTSPRIVSEDNIKFLFEVQKKVDAIRANHSGLMVSLQDICLKPLDKECATQSILQYFKMDPDNFDNYGGVEHLTYCFEHYSSADQCMSAFKGPLDPSTVLGGFSGNDYSGASAFIVTYPVNNAIDEEGNENAKAVAWEKTFIQLVKDELLPMAQSKNLTLAFSSESSIEEELKRESTADVITILVSYLVMFAYISLTLGDTPQLSSFYISSKVLLGLSGVILVMLSVLGSVGIFSALGVKSTLIIMEVIPFLVLAVGVDNMCILVHAVKRQQLELPLERRISNALEEVGPSITLASLSEVLAFAAGSFISMPACRVFSMFAALAVLLDFLLQVTAFVALIALDSLRAEDKRVDCFPCIKMHSLHAESDKGIEQRKPGLLARYMKEVHAPILRIWGVKIVVIAIFVAFALASIALSTRIEPGLEQEIVLPRDSYLQGYFNNVTKYLRIGPPLYFVVKNYNYSSESTHTNQLCSISQCNSDSLLTEIAKAALVPDTSYIAKPAASWLDDFLVWVSPEAFGCCRKFTNGSYCPPDDQPPCCAPEDDSCVSVGVCNDCTTCFRHSDLHNDRPSTTQFREKLPWFLSALPSADCAKGGHGAYTSSVELKGYDSGIIQASSFRTYHTPLNKQVDFVNSMRAAREFSSRVSDSLKIEIFPYSVFYMFFEQYLNIWKTALVNLAIAIGAVFIVCLVITGSLWSSAIILLVLTMIVVDLMGMMAILNIQLNAISVVNLVMSVGIAVEFSVHLTHSFTVASGNKDQRVKEALGTMGASVFSGITLTKLVGVIVLCFSRTEVFVVYYFQMYLSLVLLGFLHGLVFLPVVLSMFGPPSRCTNTDQEEDRSSTSS